MITRPRLADRWPGTKHQPGHVRRERSGWGSGLKKDTLRERSVIFNSIVERQAASNYDRREGSR